MAARDTKPFPVTFDDEELRARLSPLQYEVTQQQGTEYAFSGELWNTKTPGRYDCVVCGAELFRSDTKFDSGTGWPSFWAPVSDDAVVIETDTSYGMVRVEARLRPLRGPPRPRLPRRAGPDRAALVHELRVARPRPRRRLEREGHRADQPLLTPARHRGDGLAAQPPAETQRKGAATSLRKRPSVSCRSPVERNVWPGTMSSSTPASR